MTVKLGKDVPDSFIAINNFQVYRKDKIQGSGGLLVYVRNDISSSRRKDLENEHFQSIWTEINPENSKPVLIGHFIETLFHLSVGMKILMTKVRRQMRRKKKYFY